MGFVTSGWQTLKWSLHQISREGRFVIACTLRHNANGLFEALTGRPAPGAGQSTVAGHNHSMQGGKPIFRSFVGGFDTGESVGYLLSDASAVPTPVSLTDRSPSVRVYINPAINSQLAGPPYLEAKLFVRMTNTSGGSSDYKFKLRNMEDGTESAQTTVTVPTGTTQTQWITISSIPVASGGWKGFDLLGGWTGGAGAIAVTACIIAETSGAVPASTGVKYDSATATTRP